MVILESKGGKGCGCGEDGTELCEERCDGGVSMCWVGLLVNVRLKVEVDGMKGRHALFGN